ncbi:MAG: HAD family hydrolase [Phycisphaerae bacterium]
MAIDMFVSDVDGTLLQQDKSISRRTLEAVNAVRSQGIGFTVISGRPPHGMKFLIESLALTRPLAALNGALIFWPNMSILQATTLEADAAAGAAEIIIEYGLELWLYTVTDWLVTDRQSPRVRHEVSVVGHEPELFRPGGALPLGITKVLGVSDDHPLVERCEAAVIAKLGNRVSASRSQPHYLDVTARRADKGRGLAELLAIAGVAPAATAVIGDGPNDIPMFKLAGLSIAMGNGSESVRSAATFTTAANTDDGFARAVDRYILPAARPANSKGMKG